MNKNILLILGVLAIAGIALAGQLKKKPAEPYIPGLEKPKVPGLFGRPSPRALWAYMKQKAREKAGGPTGP